MSSGRVSRSLALAALVPLLALGLMGFSLAHWDDEVKVTGSVSMGVFNVTMSLEDVFDNEGSLDVGVVSASVGDWDDGDDTDGGINDLLSIVISNIYPGYVACVIFNVDNEGSIPAETTVDSLMASITTSFDWDSYKEYFKFNLSYLPDPTDTSSAILLYHLDDDGNLVTDYDFGTDPEGILYLDAGETQYFMLCFGLEAEPVNAPEDLMGQTIELTATINWIQAVP